MHVFSVSVQECTSCSGIAVSWGVRTKISFGQPGLPGLVPFHTKREIIWGRVYLAGFPGPTA